jgi:hypothetical protein
VIDQRNLRTLCWALVVLAIVAAALTLMITFAIFVPPPPVEGTDLVENLLADRLADKAIFPYVFVQSVATAGVFLIAALLGVALRGWAAAGSMRDRMTLLLVIGGALGIGANVLNIAVANVATYDYCDCLYKNEGLISQQWALSLGYASVNWFSIAAVALVGVGVGIAGRLVNVSPTWRTLSLVIAVVILAALVVRTLASFVFISAFDPFQVTDLVIAATLAILVPIWAVMLARGAQAMPENALAAN